jgi:hypothetical protein
MAVEGGVYVPGGWLSDPIHIDPGADTEMLAKDRAAREAARRKLIGARREGAQSYQGRIGEFEKAMESEGVRTRMLAAGNMARYAPFGESGGATGRAGMGAALQAGAALGAREQTGLERLAGMDITGSQLEEGVAQAQLDFDPAAERQLKMAAYTEAFNAGWEAEGEEGARAAVNNMLRNETDPVVRNQALAMANSLTVAYS